jgi:hypothetical protein
MTAVRLLQLMRALGLRHGKKTFALKELAVWAGEPRPTAAMGLLRAEKKGLVSRIGNLWINREDPPEILDIALALPGPSYLSFESALYHHGILSQAPRGGLTMATAGKPRRWETPWGFIRFIHLKPPLFFGFDSHRIASPEKAWLDLVYLRRLRNRNAPLTETVYLNRLGKTRLKTMSKKFPVWVSKIDSL